MKKLALLASARPKYAEKMMEVVNKKTCGCCWSGWTYQIHEKSLNILKKEFDREGYFNIYYHDIKKPKNIKKYGRGTGSLYQLVTEKKDYIYKDEPFVLKDQECIASRDKNKEHRLYIYVTEEPIPIHGERWNTLTDYFSNKKISHYKWVLPDVYFGYVNDPLV